MRKVPELEKIVSNRRRDQKPYLSLEEAGARANIEEIFKSMRGLTGSESQAKQT